MSKVDLTVFHELLAACEASYGIEGKENDELDLDRLIYKLCDNDFSEVYNIPYNGDYEKYKVDLKALEQIWGYERLDQDGGGEGGSEYCYGVFRLKGNVYKAEYSYYSYAGHEYDGIVDTLKIVKPVEKTIIVWEAEDE